MSLDTRAKADMGQVWEGQVGVMYQETGTKELPVDANISACLISYDVSVPDHNEFKPTDLMKPLQSISQHLNYGEVL